jgi:hypothetical protein
MTIKEKNDKINKHKIFTINTPIGLFDIFGGTIVIIFITFVLLFVYPVAEKIENQKNSLTNKEIINEKINNVFEYKIKNNLVVLNKKIDTNLYPIEFSFKEGVLNINLVEINDVKINIIPSFFGSEYSSLQSLCVENIIEPYLKKTKQGQYIIPDDLGHYNIFKKHCNHLNKNELFKKKDVSTLSEYNYYSQNNITEVNLTLIDKTNFNYKKQTTFIDDCQTDSMINSLFINIDNNKYSFPSYFYYNENDALRYINGCGATQKKTQYIWVYPNNIDLSEKIDLPNVLIKKQPKITILSN